MTDDIFADDIRRHIAERIATRCDDRQRTLNLPLPDRSDEIAAIQATARAAGFDSIPPERPARDRSAAAFKAARNRDCWAAALKAAATRRARKGPLPYIDWLRERVRPNIGPITPEWASALAAAYRGYVRGVTA